MLPVVFLMAPAVYSNWSKTNYNNLSRKLGKILFYALVIAYVWMNFYYKSDIFVVYLGISLALFTIIASGIKIFQFFGSNLEKNYFKTILSIPSSTIANSLAHIGIGVLIIGVTISTYYSSQKEIIMVKGSDILIQDTKIKFVDVEGKLSSNYTSQVGIFDAYKDDKYVISFFPEKRTYNIQKNVMTEAAIDSRLMRDIYIALGEKIADDSWVVRIYYKPFIQLLWYGVGLMILGGFFGIFSRNKFVNNN
jgi:cytochrome c-type biogenesis protein CcmF